MSDAVAAPSAPEAAQPATTPSAPAPGSNPAQASETNAQKQARLLAEEDMDAEIDLKINGQVKRAKLRDVVGRAQKGEAAENVMREAREIDKRARQILDAFKDPNSARNAIREIARQYKISPAELAKAVWDEEQTELSKSPEQRELEQLRREREQRKRDDEERTKAEETARVEAETKWYQDKIVRSYTSALDAHGFPADPELRAEAMAYMASRHKQDGSIPYRKVAQEATERFRTRTQKFLQHLPVDKRTELLDEETIAHLRGAAATQQKQALIPEVNRDQPRGSDGKFVAQDDYRSTSRRSIFHDPE